MVCPQIIADGFSVILHGLLVKRLDPRQNLRQQTLKERTGVGAHAHRLELVVLIDRFADVCQLVHKSSKVLMRLLGALLRWCQPAVSSPIDPVLQKCLQPDLTPLKRFLESREDDIVEGIGIAAGVGWCGGRKDGRIFMFTLVLEP
jgi:hypothetical protein